MATSVFFPVCCTEAFVKRRSTLAIFMPRPTCLGFVPPMLPFGADAPERFCEIISAKVTRLDLNPVVLTFAMLLPMTSMRVWCPLSPETPENMERCIMNLSFAFLTVQRSCHSFRKQQEIPSRKKICLPLSAAVQLLYHLLTAPVAHGQKPPVGPAL